MSDEASYRRIVRSTSIMAAASLINVMIGLVRIKVIALVLGPVGVGLLGLLNNLVAIASNISALGMGSAGTRQVADAVGREDGRALTLVRRALLWGTLVMAVTGSLVFWLLRDVLAAHVLGGAAIGEHLGWLASAVGLTVASSSQGALLNGMRRIGDLARLTIWTAGLSTVMGVGAVLLWKENGLIVYMLVAPATTFLLGHYYVARLPAVQGGALGAGDIAQEYRKLASLGLAFMLAGLVAMLSQLAVRSMLQRRLGPEALGLFEAAWVISMTYVGFVLSAMGTDYFPRLSAVVRDHQAVRKLVNEQTEVALLIAGPIFLAMLALAPCVVQLLYSSRFVEAAAILRWQIMGDMLKVVSWPLGFVLLARGDGRSFLLSEIAAYAVLVVLTWVGIPGLGILSVGVAFLGMYMVYLPLVYWLARRRVAFRWSRRTVVHGGVLFVSGAALSGLGDYSELLAGVVGSLLAAGAGGYAIWRLASLDAMPGPLKRLMARFLKTKDAVDL